MEVEEGGGDVLEDSFFGENSRGAVEGISILRFRFEGLHSSFDHTARITPSARHSFSSFFLNRSLKKWRGGEQGEEEGQGRG